MPTRQQPDAFAPKRRGQHGGPRRIASFPAIMFQWLQQAATHGELVLTPKSEAERGRAGWLVLELRKLCRRMLEEKHALAGVAGIVLVRPVAPDGTIRIVRRDLHLLGWEAKAVDHAVPTAAAGVEEAALDAFLEGAAEAQEALRGQNDV